jgi:hypothetical protein
MNRVVIDVTRDMFANGQFYVALSRCTQLNNVFIRGLDKHCLQYRIKYASPDVSRFYHLWFGDDRIRIAYLMPTAPPPAPIAVPAQEGTVDEDLTAALDAWDE